MHLPNSKLLSVCALLGMAGITSGTPIVFTHTGTGSGTIGSSSFTNVAFTITGIGDTANRGTFTGGLWIPATAAIDIAGLGSFNFTNTLRWKYHFDGGIGLEDYLFSDVEIFLTGGFGTMSWDMLTSIGPISGFGAVDKANLPTSGGIFTFSVNVVPTGTFQAVVGAAPVPEPASIFLAGPLLAGMLFGKKLNWIVATQAVLHSNFRQARV